MHRGDQRLPLGEEEPNSVWLIGTRVERVTHESQGRDDHDAKMLSASLHRRLGDVRVGSAYVGNDTQAQRSAVCR
jgi:hypothetical protein